MKQEHLIAILSLTGVISCYTSVLHAAEPAAVGKGTPKIQFETDSFDFGKITGTELVSGAFKFKNIGDGILKVDPPQASCDCTLPDVKPDTLAPGQSGEILYTIRLDRPLTGQRLIRVHSNDPDKPNVELAVQVEYVPLYEISPKKLWITLPPGKDEMQGSFTVTRTDGQPLQIERFTASQRWMTAAFTPSFEPADNSAQVSVIVRRPPGPPSPINASIQIWVNHQTNRPVQTIPVLGEALGELAAVPSRLYWVIPDFGTQKTNYPAESLTRTIELTSVLGHEIEIKKATSSIKGLSIQIVPKETGKKFELMLTFDQLPQEFSNGKVTIETSLASLPKIEVPIIVAVPGPR